MSSRGGRAQTRTPNAGCAPRLRTVRKKVTLLPGRTVLRAARWLSDSDVRAAVTLTPAGATVAPGAFAAVTAAVLVRRPGSSARARTVMTTRPPAG